MSNVRYLIVHTDHQLSLGGVNSGAERATLCLAEGIASLGHRVTLVGRIKDTLNIKSTVEFVDVGEDFDLRPALDQVSKEGPYHLISAGRAMPFLMTIGDKNCLSKTLICHDPSGSATGVSSETLAKHCDRVISVSEAQKRLIVNAGFPAQKITVVNNGIDKSKFICAANENRDLDRIIFVGALVRDKGIELLIHSFLELKKIFPRLKLDVYGSSSMWGREKILDEKKIENEVPGIKFHGAVSQDRLVKAYQNAAFCVLPSIWFDSYPLTSLEAQSCGCPVVAFDIGGMKETILNCESGLVIPEISLESLTNTLSELLRDKDRLNRLIATTRKVSSRIPSWQDTAKKITELAQSSSVDEEKYSGVTEGVIGYLSTWNQECGIARYAEHLAAEYPQNSYVILAEETSSPRQRPDEAFVERCWQKGSNDFTKLKSVIDKYSVKLLHINIHQAGIFPTASFCTMLRELRSRGIKIIAQLHTTFTTTEALVNLGSCVDKAIVHTQQNRLQLVANGWRYDNILVTPHGISDSKNKYSNELVRKELGIPQDQKVALTFGFIQPHKGMEALIEGVKQLQDSKQDVHGYIVGGVNESDPNSRSYSEQLKQYATKLNIANKIHFIEGYIPEEKLEKYIAVADVVVLNYLSQHHELSAACATALSLGKVVATSLAPAFAEFGDSVWTVTSGYPMSVSLERLLFNQELRSTLENNVKKLSQTRSWNVLSRDLRKLYLDLGIRMSATSKDNKDIQNKTDRRGVVQTKQIKILMQNRPNAYTQPGGDTVVMEHTRVGVEKRGAKVTVDLEAKEDPKNYDIVHLFNFALPDYVKILAQNAKAAGVPYVVTTLYEDVPNFHYQSHVLSKCLIEYVSKGQDERWFETNRPNLKDVKPSGHFNNTWTAQNSAGLFVSGPSEGKILERDYGKNLPIFPVMFGSTVAKRATAEKFIQTYGIKDFVLCVGRLETRKNQLMLLKALENTDIPVVIIGSGFSYQPEYAEAVQKFKRQGKTLILGRLDNEMLASAYCAAKVHALPSFYELPGLVSLEAAYYGCNVVASGNSGTIEDYLGDLAFYCDPKDERSIREAVLKALSQPYDERMRNKLTQYSWENMAQIAFDSYQQILGLSNDNKVFMKQEGAPMAPTFDMDNETTTFQDLLERGELATKNRRNDEARSLFDQAEKINPQSVRLMMARGALNLASSDIEGAKKYFDRALAIKSDDPKSLIGRGMCEVMNKNHAMAYDYFVKALNTSATELVAIHQLIECAFVLNRFTDVTVAIEKYLNNSPQDLEMRFCLAGCYYKSQNYLGARAQLQSVLSQNSTHRGALELSSRITEEERSLPKQAATNITATESVPTVSMPKNVSVVYLDEEQSETQVISPSKTRNTLIDMQLAELNEKKRNREIDSVKSGCDLILKNPEANNEQIEFAKILIAETAILEGNLEKASDIYQEVVRANPRSARALCGQAALRANSNDWLKAEELFSEALKYDSRSDVAYAGLGMCAAQMRNVQKAWEHYRASLKINPENLRAVLGIIELGYPMKKLKEVEEAVRGYLELHSADCNFMYSLAGCLFAQERYHEALEELERLIMFEPSNNHALELRSLIIEKLGIAQTMPQRMT